MKKLVENNKFFEFRWLSEVKIIDLNDDKNFFNVDTCCHDYYAKIGLYPKDIALGCA